jgi:GxxExxY protein
MDVFEMRATREKKADEHTEALAHAVIGALIEVHKHLGPGLPEKSYQEAISHELTLRSIKHRCEVPFPIMYKGKCVGEGRIDVLVEERLVIEVKAVEALTQVHRAQCVTYLQAMKLELALLANFNVAMMADGIKRVINTF